MKLWGGVFGDRPPEGTEAFNTSIFFDWRLWPHDLMGSAAHCRMLVKQGILPRDAGEAILKGLSRVRDELRDGRLAPAVEWEDIHTRVEGRLQELIGEPAGRLHTARSRNDQVALDLRLFARDALLEELEAVGALLGALIGLAERSDDVIAPGYTHLRKAQPVLLAHHWLAYAAMFQRDAERLLDCYRRTDVSPLGSGALAGVSYPIDRQYTAELLGFAAITTNSMDAVSDRDFVVEHLAAVTLIAAHLSRLAEELIVWSTTEFSLIGIPEAYSTGSSIMPQKRNPDVLELVRGKFGRVLGHLVGILTVLKGQPLAYNKDLQEDKEALFDAVDTVLDCLRIGGQIVADLTIRSERMRQAAEADFLLATDYADYLAKQGMPFREAHRVVGKLVRKCEADGRTLQDLSLAELEAASELFGSDLVGFTARQAVEGREVPGGTGPRQVAAARTAALENLNVLRDHATRLRARLPSLERLLSAPLI